MYLFDGDLSETFLSMNGFIAAPSSKRVVVFYKVDLNYLSLMQCASKPRR